ncbi:hypothetical protein [Maribellus sp. YY47]|uniref:hypothetical protein n=1 Tax=Maribellus sp. YY47 TaxID=2929486 RepID=UPI002000AEFA|nr:hypothetical protein [Maribellus sp. YY47]MCK3682852.1 hypothetical protein [Maribellus sp. YY47]
MKKVITLSILTFILSACSFSFSKKNEIRTKNQSIDGVEYWFNNYAEYRNTQVLFVKNFQLKNRVSFYGMGQAIEKTIYKSDFEKQIDFNAVDDFQIDSVSFLINERKDKIDLIYYVNLGNQHKSVSMILQKDKDDWTLQ